MSWQHIRPQSMAWQPTAPGLSTRLLTQTPFAVRQYRLAGHADGPLQGMVLVQEGGGMSADGVRIGRGDLLWRRSVVNVTAGPEGVVWSVLELPESLRPAVDTLTVGATDRPWQEFADPAGRPTQPVQVLLEGALSALRTRFVPTYEAGEHWHDFDTLYFIMNGDMQFGFEGQYYAGDLRQVKGGFSYGPEKPGPSGVEFVLFSCGGPVNLHWSDLEAPPRGSLLP
jgi:hypothetical protein